MAVDTIFICACKSIQVLSKLISLLRPIIERALSLSLSLNLPLCITLLVM